MDKVTADKLIDKTRDDYNLIAEHFARTRYYIWKDIENATKDFDLDGKEVLDLGSGNGRLYEFLTSRGAKYTGLDLGDKLVEYSRKKYPAGTFIQGDLTKTPFNNAQFDNIYCIATLHHIPSRAGRKAAIEEMYRILKPGGHIFTTNWYFWNKPKYLKLIIKSIFTNNELPFGDFYMPWKKPDTSIVTTRYFHAWTKWENRSLLWSSGFRKIRIAGFKHRLWFLLGPNLNSTAEKPE